MSISPEGKDRNEHDHVAHVAAVQQYQHAAAEQGTRRQEHLLLDSNTSSPTNVQDDNGPPAYGDVCGEIHAEKDGLNASASITDDGRVNIRITQLQRRLSQILTPALNQQLQDAGTSDAPTSPYMTSPTDVDSRPPRLNIVMQVVGSRGDVQPFIALGKVLKVTYGHRVRLATHPTFRDFVQSQGLEFFSIGGDPARLMAFMVKNPSLRPTMRSVASGDIGQRRNDVAEYIQGCWRSCYEIGDGINDQSSHSLEAKSQHFVADLIIANPPSLAHIHCAEKLRVPLHIVFTMPYSPTRAFPHPLANIQSSSADPRLTNYISYGMIDLLTWQALEDVINRFRTKCLGLDRVSLAKGQGMLQRLRIPHTYCWSPALIPKPTDWGSHISISAFCFLEAPDYTPAADLLDFLDMGSTPIYIGFGSIVLEDPDAMTELIFEVARRTGQRVLLSKGWAGMGAEDLAVPDSVFMLGNVPHDWLFKHVSCVIHHGGAGTTAAGIAAGRPTLVVPFFGDQPFWGAMIARAGAGPQPISHRDLTAAKLADAIHFCLRPESLACAQELASRIVLERGCDSVAQSIHRTLEPERLRCSLTPTRAACWRIRGTNTKLSAFAAHTLADADLLDLKDLKLYRSQEHYVDEGPPDPISGGFTAAVRAFGDMAVGLTELPSEPVRAYRYHLDRENSKSKTKISATEDRGISSSAAGSSTCFCHVPSDNVDSLDGTTSGIPHPTDETSSLPSKDPVSGPTIPRTDFLGAEASSSRPPSVHSPKPGDILRPNRGITSKGTGRFFKALVQGPVNISTNLTRGMHNVPKLWGDDTVRPQERISGFNSGMKAAGREFGFGFYDAITGLVTQPLKGAREGGLGGLAKGVGKGVGGFLPKLGAANLGLLSHSLEGINKEIQNWFRSDVQSYVVASRAEQGYQEWLASSEREKRDVIEQWKTVRKDMTGKHGSSESEQTVLQDHERTGSGVSLVTTRDTLNNCAPTDQEIQSNLSHDFRHFAGTTKNGLTGGGESSLRKKTADEETEEKVVIEYIKKQSLLEAEHQSNANGRTSKRSSDDDESLQPALRQSSFADKYREG